jgi:DNA-binding NtrC family response regulator
MSRVLLIDDDDGIRLSLSILFEDEGGWLVEQAATSTEARDALAAHAFDAILLDRHIGRDNGADLVPLVRSTQPRARLVLFTGASTGEAVEREVDAVAIKGIAFPELLAIVRPPPPGAG